MLLVIADVRLGKRLLSEALPDGRRVESADLQRLVDDHYRLRGWEKTGQLSR